MLQNPVAVEKLLRPKFAKIKLRYDALQTTFLIFETFCIPQILAVWEETGVFQQPQAVTLRIPAPGILSRVEKRRKDSSLPVAISGAFATPPQSGLT